ncbi:MAG: winged helix DNA-binding protein [Erythrobacter sp.]
MNEDEKAEIRGLANRLFGLTGFELHEGGGGDVSGVSIDPADSLCRTAARELGRRGVRKHYLPPDLFAEGGWNMLLDLFLQERQGNLVSIMSICTAADVPPTTALRYLGLLMEMGFVHRIEDRQDRRRQLVRLTPAGQGAMEKLLTRFEEAEQKADRTVQVLRGPAQ